MAKEILAGVIGGLTGTLAMSISMMIGAPTDPKPPPPLEMEREPQHRVGVTDQTTAGEEKAKATVLHLLIGITFGGGYRLRHGTVTALMTHRIRALLSS